MGFSFASKFNRASKFDIDTNGFGYMSLADLYNQNGKDATYPLAAIYINTKGKFGDAPVFATDSYYVNVPRHMLDACNDILNDDEAIRAINAKQVGFTIHQYTQKRYNRVCFGVSFVDVDWNN